MTQSDNITLLNDAVARYGQPPEMAEFLKHIMHAESGGNAAARNPNSSACGIFQFINSTWNQYGHGSIYDPAAQCDAVVRFSMDNAKVLKTVLGREPNAGEYYLAHFAGPEGARQTLTHNPSTPIRDFLGDGVIKANASIRFKNKSFKDFSAGDLQEWAAARMSIDFDARHSYDERRKKGLTTKEDDERETEVRRHNLEAMGLSKTMIDAMGSSILGQLFMAVLTALFDASTPPSERAVEKPQDVHTAQAAPSPTPKTTVRQAQLVHA